MAEYEEYVNLIHEECPFTVLFCGTEACPPGYYWGGVRSHFLFHYVISGNGRLKTDEASRQIYEGGGFFLFPGQPHNYRADTLHPWKYTWLGIGGGRQTEQLFEQIGITRENPTFQASLDPNMLRLMKALMQTLKTRPPGYPLLVNGLANFVFARLARLVPSERQTKFRLSGDVVRDAKAYVTANFHRRSLSVKAIAESVGYDQSTLFRRFKKSEGVNVYQYLKEQRLTEAERLLTETGLPVSGVAASVGMAYVPFYRALKARTGMSPQDFRTRHQKTANR